MNAPEHQNIEYKASWHDDYLQWICGFANAQGGKIYIGKNDAGITVGVDDYKDLMEKIPNKIKNLMGITAEVNLLQEMIGISSKLSFNPIPCRFPCVEDTTTVAEA